MLVEKLGGIEEAKAYLEWMKDNDLMMGSYHENGSINSFYDFNLQKAIEDYYDYPNS